MALLSGASQCHPDEGVALALARERWGIFSFQVRKTQIIVPFSLAAEYYLYHTTVERCPWARATPWL